MFETVPAAPPDPIYNLTTECNLDPNPRKLNLGVGVFKDDAGAIPILEAVKTAEQRIWREEETKNYLPIDGSGAFGLRVRQLLLGEASELAADPTSITVQTPGGTGALRLACELLARQLPNARMWISDPTWANHGQVCQQAGLPFASYPYYRPADHAIDEDAFFAVLAGLGAGDIVMLHGCCHNPTGMDLNRAQWDRVRELAQRRGFLILIDIAYQGFAQGLDADAEGVRLLAEAGLPLLICSSYSKNFGLYNERIGALTCVGLAPDVAARVQSQLKVHARTLWSSPPQHGSRIVETVLGDPELRRQWDNELARMRDRINQMRGLLVETMQEVGSAADFSFIARQYGLFSLTGISSAVNAVMRERHSIYFMSTGRINVAGLTPATIDYFCRAYQAAISEKA